ncbi:MAG: hypothetical protein IIZ44_05000 [Muribaculaceae bacterium]|nr:hypothetical protein [Muribaculaceae bacterium]
MYRELNSLVSLITFEFRPSRSTTIASRFFRPLIISISHLVVMPSSAASDACDTLQPSVQEPMTASSHFSVSVNSSE